MEIKDEVQHKSFIGTYIPIRYPMFSVKLLLLLSTSFIFLSQSGVLRIVLLVLSIVLNVVFLRKKALLLGKFLLISTCVLLVVWCLVMRPADCIFSLETCLKTLQSDQLHYALTRLWGLFAVGQLFASCTSQYEILVFLRRIRANYVISVFVILVGNAFSYFIQLYRQISEGYRMRCRVRNPITRVFHVLTSLMLNALMLVSGCKKVDMLYENRIRNSILRTGLNHKGVLPSSLNFHFTNVLYPNQDQPILRSVALEAKLGDIILVTGANGSGKTTLLNLIAKIIPNIVNASYEGGIKDADMLEGEVVN